MFYLYKNNNHLFLKLVLVPSSVPVLLQYHLCTTTLLLSCIQVVLFLRYRYLRFLGFRTGSFVTWCVVENVGIMYSASGRGACSKYECDNNDSAVGRCWGSYVNNDAIIAKPLELVIDVVCKMDFKDKCLSGTSGWKSTVLEFLYFIMEGQICSFGAPKQQNMFFNCCKSSLPRNNGFPVHNSTKIHPNDQMSKEIP